MQSRKMFQVLFVAVLCTVVFVAAAFAGDREDPKGNPGAKAPHRIVLQKAGPVGHWHSVQSFNHTVPSPLEKSVDSCSGSCNCSTCGCYGTLGCCLGGCDFCWDQLDSRGACDAV
jgi:hypothetical protein